LADAVVSRDEDEALRASHQIMQYEAPDIIDQDSTKTVVRNIKRVLEYGLLESRVWDQASGGREVAILNPSVATLKRVIKMKGEKPVYFTEMGVPGTEYFMELQKVMVEQGYNKRPVRASLQSIPREYSYYLGFSGGKDSRTLVPHMFGFELNPYHPDSLNGMMSGVMKTKMGTRIEIARGSYTRYEYYEDEPTYNRYYGDVVSPFLKDKKVGGEEAFNFVSSCDIPLFQRKESLLNEGDVLCDGFFFAETIFRKELINKETYYFDRFNNVMDVERSCSYENRRQLIIDAKLPYELASCIHDSRRAKFAFLRYRTSGCNIEYTRPNEVKKCDQVNVSLNRYTVQYGTLKNKRFVKALRDSATHIWTPEFGYRLLDEGFYPCDVGEFVQLLDESMLRACVETDDFDGGVEAIIKDGRTPFNCVSGHGGVWRTLQYCRLDVDFKSNFNLVQVFKSYTKFIGPFYKRSLVIAKGNAKVVQTEMDKQSFEFDDQPVYIDVELDGQMNDDGSDVDEFRPFEPVVEVN